MPFITVSDEVAKKSFTQVENKFITKYLPVLEPMAVKVYLYSLYVYQCGNSHYTVDDLAQTFSITADEAKGCFEYLEELELVAITSLNPFEIKILDAENVYGTPKKFKPEKYSDFTKSVQNVIKGRMISTNEFREYFCLLEDYGFEQNALLMIINYCVNLKGEDIRSAYIKKVAKSFADEGITTAKKVDEKLAAYTSSTPALIRIFTAAGIKKQPDVDDDRLYKKWTGELGFDEGAIVAAAKYFKA
ncbi:MAG: DnaD domain protein, partial [Clostridia bacterium]|nr:DnaD domain protein [Clostridia bacterium]